MSKIWWLITLLAVVMTGCTSLPQVKPSEMSLERDKVISTPASISNTFVVSDKSKFVICAQPPPDAILDQGEAADFSITFVNIGGGDKGGEEEESAELEMTGRTPALLLARELLYRLCEFSRNHHLDKKVAIRLYEKNLNIIQAVSLQETQNTTLSFTTTETVTESTSVSDSASTALPGTPVEKATTASPVPDPYAPVPGG